MYQFQRRSYFYWSLDKQTQSHCLSGELSFLVHMSWICNGRKEEIVDSVIIQITNWTRCTDVHLNIMSHFKCVVVIWGKQQNIFTPKFPTFLEADRRRVCQSRHRGHWYTKPHADPHWVLKSIRSCYNTLFLWCTKLILWWIILIPFPLLMWQIFWKIPLK